MARLKLISFAHSSFSVVKKKKMLDKCFQKGKCGGLIRCKDKDFLRMIHPSYSKKEAKDFMLSELIT